MRHPEIPRDLLHLTWYVRLVRGPFLQMASWFSA